jgi:hypothetical protein
MTNVSHYRRFVLCDPAGELYQVGGATSTSRLASAAASTNATNVKTTQASSSVRRATTRLLQ